MLKLKVQSGKLQTTVSFPCSDTQLYTDLAALRVQHYYDTKHVVLEVEGPEELGCLRNRYVELDEVNYLAKRLDSLCRKEMDQFFEAMRREGFYEVKDLINLTFNLDKYTVITDLSDTMDRILLPGCSND